MRSRTQNYTSAGSLYIGPTGHFLYFTNSATLPPQAPISQQSFSSTNIDVVTISGGGPVDRAMLDPGRSPCSEQKPWTFIVLGTKPAKISYSESRVLVRREVAPAIVNAIEIRQQRFI